MRRHQGSEQARKNSPIGFRLVIVALGLAVTVGSLLGCAHRPSNRVPQPTDTQAAATGSATGTAAPAPVANATAPSIQVSTPAPMVEEATATVPLPTLARFDPTPAVTQLPSTPTPAFALPTSMPSSAPTAATPARPTPTPSPVPITEWRGEYYNNMDLSGEPLLRNDAAIDFEWGTGRPATGVNPDGFSARWTRHIEFAANTYRFSVRVDDGARLWVDGQRLIDQWQDGPARTLVAEQFLDQGEHDIRLEMYDRAGDATAQLWWEKEESFPDWKGEYFANASLDGTPVLVRNDKVIDFHWGTEAPARGLPSDHFSIRWTRELYTPDGFYRFSVDVDDGVRLWVDGLAIIDEWHNGQDSYSGEVVLTEGQHAVQLEVYEDTGDARCRLRWELTSTEPIWRAKYFGNPGLQGPPVLARNDAEIDFNWGAGAPAPGLPTDGFSARWVLKQQFAAGTYLFCASADDGVKVALDDEDILINEWHDGSGIYCADRQLPEGIHKLRVEYYENLGGAMIQFRWKQSGS